MTTVQTMRVTLDGTYTYIAQVDPTIRWNGWLCPGFQLEEVKRIAENECAGYESEGIHVIEGYQYCGKGLDVKPAYVVLHVCWPCFADEGPQRATSVIEPDKHGMYPIGAFEWTWREAGPEEGLA